MSKQGYFQRYFCIISNIKKHKLLTYDSIQEFVHKLADQNEANNDSFIGFSKRTFQRDIKEIQQLFSITILFDRKAGAYYIEEETNNLSDRMLEILDVFNTVQMSNKTSGVIYLEPRRPTATYYIDTIVTAINKKQKLNLQYKKFSEKQISKRTLAPYAVKEFKNRWYLLAMEDGTNYLKSFAFDRIITLQTDASSYFQLNENINIETLYNNCFGIIMPQHEKVQKVILAFDNFQKEYIKSLPLHHSQEILLETEEQMQIGLTIYITHDFVTEILSYGSHVKVLKPLSLIQKVKTQLEKALINY